MLLDISEIEGPSNELSKSMIDVQWGSNPKRDERLLAWLEKNRAERETIMYPAVSPQQEICDGKPRKATCILNAALHVFALDEDSRLHLIAQAIEGNIGRYVGIERKLDRLIRSRIQKWKDTYQRINERLGKRAANMPIEKIKEAISNDKIYNSLKNDMQSVFPPWDRLHKIWILNPNFNPFAGSKNDVSKRIPSISDSESPSYRGSSSLVKEVDDTKKDVVGERGLAEWLRLKKARQTTSPGSLNVRPKQTRSGGTGTQSKSRPTRAMNLQNAAPAAQSLTQSRKRRVREDSHSDLGESANPAGLSPEPVTVKEEKTKFTGNQLHAQYMAKLEYDFKRRKLEEGSVEKAELEIRRLELECRKRKQEILLKMISSLEKN